MTLYHSLGNAIGTTEAIELAQRLAVWHDAMVMHQRRAGTPRGSRCEAGCPHVEAASLWLEALTTYGERAHELAFLRTHGTAAGSERQRWWDGTQALHGPQTNGTP